jgi:multicomponent Na+:H+ antiporter subunit B
MDLLADLDTSTFVDVVLLALMLLAAFAIIFIRHLFSVVMVSGVYSLLSAAVFVNLDAVDVAFTEAAVGAGISTILFLGALVLTARREKIALGRRPILPLLIVLVTGAALVYATYDMPAFGDSQSPANVYVGIDYIERTPKEIDIPNIVTAVLASYRGFDTLGETVVVFTAGLGVMILLGFGLYGGVGTREKDEEGQ